MKNWRDLSSAAPEIASGRFYRTGCLSYATVGTEPRLVDTANLRTIVDLRSAYERSEAKDPQVNNDDIYGGYPLAAEMKAGLTGRAPLDIEAGGDKRRYFIAFLDEKLYTWAMFWGLKKRSKIKMLTQALAAPSKRIRTKLKLRMSRAINDGGLGLLNDIILRYSGAQLCSTLKLAATPERHPVAMYCTAGKDRTGIIVMLTLAALGVDDEAIVADYVKSDNAYRDLNDKKAMVGALEQHNLDPDLFLVAPEYVARGVLEAVNEEYGGIEAYLDSIGFDAAWRLKLRDAMLA